MRKIIFVLVITIGVLAISGCSKEKSTLDKVLEDNNYIVVDVRTASEYSESHVKGSINIPYDEIDEYELGEEENAVIYADELERRTKERMDALGLNDNQAAIQKYEEEQEKKAIISYEQLLKNASNITLSFKEEDKKDADAPIVNKVEIEQKEVTGAESYLEEEEFLKILKEFRTSL